MTTKHTTIPVEEVDDHSRFTDDTTKTYAAKDTKASADKKMDMCAIIVAGFGADLSDTRPSFTDKIAVEKAAGIVELICAHYAHETKSHGRVTQHVSH